MCGIAGIIQWSPDGDPRAAAGRMASALGHRGPDGTAIRAQGAVALAHCRLAIIDLARGQQPMSNETGTIHLVANCEIYNYRELRRDLESRGHHFATDSDAEVIIHGYEEWGTALPPRLRGMFAFAIVDFDRARAFLARDHFGIKPLVWHRSDHAFVFASELRALRAGLRETPGGSLEAVELYLRYRYIPAPHTIYRDVFKLPPASWLEVSFDGAVAGPRKYWAVHFTPDADDPGDDATWAARVEETLAESVTAHMVADVPYGVLLSGGVDSTVVSQLARRSAGRPLPAFTIDFTGDTRSEVGYARAAADHLGLELHVATVGPEAVSMLPVLANHFGEPFGDPSALPTWSLARLARDHVPMVLSGDGGDEAFGGYDSYAAFLRGDSVRTVVGTLRRSPAEGLTRAARYARHHLTGRMTPTVAEWERWILCFRADERMSLWRGDYGSLVERHASLFDAPAESAPYDDALAFAQAMDYQTYLPGNILAKVDMASMAHGLEVRTPLVDRDVVSLASRLPLRQRWRTGTPAGTVRKYALRQLLEPDFPPAFIHRAKQGFVGPHAAWMLHDEAMRALLAACLLDEASPLRALFRPSAMREQVESHCGDHDNSSRIWLLLILGLWMDANPDVRFS